MKLRVIAVGRIKDRELESLCETYVTRSRTLMPIERVACKDTETALAKGREAGKLVLLDERGETLSSPQLAAWLGALRDASVRDVAFVIGDADGFGPAHRAQADKTLSLSAMTLPHRVAQLVLVEQLYRAGTILAGHPYHHQ
jgi:23S rRNA (pseudouridine1915-N3)-methyltransferase